MKNVDTNKLVELPIIKLKGFNFSTYMPRGKQSEIVNKLDTNKARVSRVVNGHEYDEEIIKEILEIIKALPKVNVPDQIAQEVNGDIRKPLLD